MGTVSESETTSLHELEYLNHHVPAFLNGLLIWHVGNMLTH